MSEKLNVAIFGGAGFIGVHFAAMLKELHPASTIYLLDIVPIANWGGNYRGNLLANYDSISYINCDVREQIPLNIIPVNIDLVCNFAAIHREPGHAHEDYFRTNILGATNICSWTKKVACNSMIFTSSISAYGPGNALKTEETLPCPNSAYGASKLVAEKIHISWQESFDRNKLLIVRPGVVFGPTENGNVSRMIKALNGGYFFYMGNHNVKKSGIYVKELCRCMYWGLKKLQSQELKPLILLNAVGPVSLSIKDYVDEMKAQLNIKRKVYSMPFAFLMILSYFLSAFGSLVGWANPFHPARVKKLLGWNFIEAKYLKENNYQYAFDLHDALTDWKKSCPLEWGIEK